MIMNDIECVSCRQLGNKREIVVDALTTRNNRQIASPYLTARLTLAADLLRLYWIFLDVTTGEITIGEEKHLMTSLPVK